MTRHKGTHSAYAMHRHQYRLGTAQSSVELSSKTNGTSVIGARADGATRRGTVKHAVHSRSPLNRRSPLPRFVTSARKVFRKYVSDGPSTARNGRIYHAHLPIRTG